MLERAQRCLWCCAGIRGGRSGKGIVEAVILHVFEADTAAKGSLGLDAFSFGWHSALVQWRGEVV